MAKKINTKSKKKSMGRKSMKNRSRKYRNLYKGGSCDCQKFLGGGKMTGGYGPSSYQPISNAHFNSYQSNPNIIPFPAIENNFPDIRTTGGKKNKNKSKKSRKNKPKIMHGGNFLTQSLANDAFGNNYTQYTGNTPGAFLGTNLISGVTNIDPSVTDGPLLYPERVYNA
jgi:hypothetical protein